jgi:hypothetical protein
MEMKTTIKLNQPKELPATGLSTVQFKPWKNHVITFLMQDPDNQEFLSGGMYEEWIAASDIPDKTGERISLVQVKVDDMTMNESLLVPFLGNISLNDAKTKNEHREMLVEAREKQKKKLKVVRNNQLARMIQHIASLVHYTEQDDIVQNSTSVKWIWTYLENHYNIAPKGANFLRITKHHYKSGVVPATFYKEFRASFLDNLRKKDEPIGTRKPNAKLKEDEVLSPSFEDAIILWTLEKIDPRLPMKVSKDYEHRLGQGTYLSDLHSSIFQAIPSMIEDLDQANGRAFRTLPDVDINAFNPTVFPDGRKWRGGGGGARGRGGPRGRAPQGAARGQARGSGAAGRIWSEKFCKFCQLAGSAAPVYESHNSRDCSMSTLRAMYLEEEEEAGKEEEYEEEGWTGEEQDS